MGVQEIVTYTIVGIAVVLTARTVIRQFISTEGSCSKCAQCGPEQNVSDQPSARLIEDSSQQDYGESSTVRNQKANICKPAR